MADLKKIEVPPGRYADPSPSPSLSVLELATRKVIVINSDPWFRSVDFGTDANGVRKVLSIPEAKTDKMHKTTVGQEYRLWPFFVLAKQLDTSPIPA